MEYLVTAEEMKRYDRITTEEIGICSLVLMERAALAVLEEVSAYCQRRRAAHVRAGGFPAEEEMSALILAGCGNNGADGLALARLLAQQGFEVEVVVCGNPEKATEEWKTQAGILRHYPVKWEPKTSLAGRKPEKQEYTVLIDALFGVGLSREITGVAAEQIAVFNCLRGYKIAVDLPSGVHADDGRIMGCAVKADLTVCLGLGKRGMYLYPGAACCGQIKVKDIGIGQAAFQGKEPQAFCYTEEIGALLPPRRADGNKGTFGKVLLAAGSRNMAGAAVLAVESCYRSGAGMVKVITPECNRIILQSVVPEALLHTYEEREDEESRKSWERDLDWADVLAVGPGLGTGEMALFLLQSFLNHSRKPLVIDADGLNLLAAWPGLQRELSSQAQAGRKVILTPHLGELSRLTGETVAAIQAHVADSVSGLAGKLGCVVAGKDARTLVCGPGSPLCLNRTGNSGMAVAGSGDVLTGIIAGLLAQGTDAFTAAAVGVYWHGLAGDAAARELGEYAMTASDLIAHMALGENKQPQFRNCLERFKN